MSAPRRWRWWLLLPLLAVAPVAAFWAFTSWSAQREIARVRELFARHAGPEHGPTDAQGTVANDAALALRQILPAMGLGRENGERVSREDPRRRPTDLVRKSAHAELVSASIEPAPLDAGTAAALASLAPLLDEARALVLEGTGPQWTVERAGLDWSSPDLSEAFALVDLLLADAFERERRGEVELAAADMEAAWRVATSVHEPRCLICIMIERAAKVRVAISARRLASLGQEWETRLDAEPLRASTLEAMRFEARAYLDPPDWPDVEGAMFEHGSAMPPLAGGPFEFLITPTMRRQLARQVEANIPVIVALEDPARCGPASLRSIPAKLGPHVRGIGWLGDIEPDVTQASRVDIARVQFELTRRLLDLRARREADPQHRWPTDLLDDGASSCPGVTFRLVELSPAMLMLEAQDPEGTWWDGDAAQVGYPARVEIPRGEAMSAP